MGLNRHLTNSRLLHKKDDADARHSELVSTSADGKIDPVAYEKDKVKGAIRTDFVLSAEIITITLGTVATAPFVTQVTVLSGIAVIMTIGVYGIVAGIVKLDDAGLYLSRALGEDGYTKFKRSFGRGILWAAPYLMKSLSIVGTIAMFLVGGGILTHGFPVVHHWIERVSAGLGGVIGTVTPTLLDGVFGVLTGAVVLLVVTLINRFRE